MIYKGRRKIVWENIRGFKSIFGVWVATASGAGLFPVAPGTMGSLVGLPIAYWTRAWPWHFRLAAFTAVTLLGMCVEKVFDEMMQTHDNQNIVIDEVVGVWVTAWTAGEDPRTWLAAFLLFRVFDVLKPPPIRQVDKWSQNQSSPGWGGFGVVADDLIAGLEGLGVVVLLQVLGVLQ